MDFVNILHEVKTLDKEVRELAKFWNEISLKIQLIPILVSFVIYSLSEIHLLMFGKNEICVS